MRFKATLLDINAIGTLAKVVLTVARISKNCVVRLTANKIYFILMRNQLHGGTSVWCELPQVNFCSSYEFVGHGERNEIYMEMPMDTLGHALKSGNQAKFLRIKLAQKATACVSVEVSQTQNEAFKFLGSATPSPTTSSVLRTITHDIPIRIIPSRLWNEYQEQGIPEFAASFYLPPLRTIKSVIERMKNISNVLYISANNKGDMALEAKSELASVKVSFKDLIQATWKDMSPCPPQHTDPSQSLHRKKESRFHEISTDIKRLYTFLSSLQLPTAEKLVCNLIPEEAIQIFMIHEQLSIQYTIPAQNIV